MENHDRMRKRKNGLILALFILSAIIGIALVTASVWGDYEASMIDVSYMGEKQLVTLSCPILITPRDKADFSAEFHNPLEHNMNVSVKVLVSKGLRSVLDEERFLFQLAPDEIRQQAWLVDPEDAVYGKLVLLKVYQHASYGLPSRDASCGILLLDGPAVPGNWLVYGSAGLSVLGMSVGIVLWQRNNRLKNRRQKELSRSMYILSGALIPGLAASLLGARIAYSWLLGGTSLVVAALLLVVTLYQILR